MLLRIVLKDGPLLSDWGDHYPAYVSRLAIVEMRRVLDRLRMNGAMDDFQLIAVTEKARDFEESLRILPLADEVLDRASQPMGVVVGTLDAIHLATAVVLRAYEVPDLIFATHDRQQARGASMLGFDVVGVDR